MTEPMSSSERAASSERTAAYDPRDRVTAYAFEVDPALLGTELATPKRRLAALLIDLVLAALLAALGGVLVGFAVAYIFVRVATRRRVQHPLKRWARGALALLGAFVLYVTVVAVLGGGWDVPFLGDDAPEPVAATDTPSAAERARGAAVRDSVRQQLRREGISPEAMQRAGLPAPLVDLLADALDASPDRSAADRSRTVGLLRAYSDALAQQDTARIDRLRPQVVTAVAGPQLQRIRQALQRADDRAGDLEDENESLREQVEDPSVWRLLRATANDFGLRIGWVGVYFTLFLAWWDGYTPGKRLLGLRVVRLDGAPLTLWLCFERFGGYAAGLATGLLGFAQVFWDPNRQAIHDRIAHTVVVRERGGA